MNIKYFIVLTSIIKICNNNWLFEFCKYLNIKLYSIRKDDQLEVYNFFGNKLKYQNVLKMF